MSLRALSEAIEDLPFALSEQVVGYARSVELAAPAIFKDAGIRPNRELINALVFIAGIRKLYSIVDSNYWIVDNTGAILASQQSQYSVRIGSTDLSRGGAYHDSLTKIRNELTELLTEHQLIQYVHNIPYSEVVRELADGR